MADGRSQESGRDREGADRQPDGCASPAEGVLDEARQDGRDDPDGDEVAEGGRGDPDERGRE